MNNNYTFCHPSGTGASRRVGWFWVEKVLADNAKTAILDRILVEVAYV